MQNRLGHFFVINLILHYATSVSRPDVYNFGGTKAFGKTGTTERLCCFKYYIILNIWSPHCSNLNHSSFANGVQAFSWYAPKKKKSYYTSGKGSLLHWHFSSVISDFGLKRPRVCRSLFKPTEKVFTRDFLCLMHLHTPTVRVGVASVSQFGWKLTLKYQSRAIAFLLTQVSAVQTWQACFWLPVLMGGQREKERVLLAFLTIKHLVNYSYAVKSCFYLNEAVKKRSSAWHCGDVVEERDEFMIKHRMVFSLPDSYSFSSFFPSRRASTWQLLDGQLPLCSLYPHHHHHPPHPHR